MAAFPIFSTITQRVQDLIGQSDGTISSFNKRNINLAVTDILNMYQFSWNSKTADLTLTSGTADLPSDFNPRWGIFDGRITSTGDNNDNIFTQIPAYERDNFSSDDYVYWITPDTTNNKYIFNSKTLTGTVAIYYNFTPTDMSADADVCSVPGIEAVAYRAAAKNWIPGERDINLRQEYEGIADKYIRELATVDQQNGAHLTLNSLARNNLSSTLSSTNEIKFEV